MRRPSSCSSVNIGGFLAGCACGANVGGKSDESWTRRNLKIVVQGVAMARGKSYILPSGVDELIGDGVVVQH